MFGNNTRQIEDLYTIASAHRKRLEMLEASVGQLAEVDEETRKRGDHFREWIEAIEKRVNAMLEVRKGKASYFNLLSKSWSEKWKRTDAQLRVEREHREQLQDRVRMLESELPKKDPRPSTTREWLFGVHRDWLDVVRGRNRILIDRVDKDHLWFKEQQDNAPIALMGRRMLLYRAIAGQSEWNVVVGIRVSTLSVALSSPLRDHEHTTDIELYY